MEHLAKVQVAKDNSFKGSSFLYSWFDFFGKKSHEPQGDNTMLDGDPATEFIPVSFITEPFEDLEIPHSFHYH